MKRKFSIIASVLFAGSLMTVPVIAVHAEDEGNEAAATNEIMIQVQDQLHYLVGRIATVLTRTEAKVVYETTLDQDTKQIIVDHLEYRLDWLEIMELRLKEADSLHEIARIHRDIQAFMSQPPRPSMGAVIGDSFEAHQAHLEQAHRRSEIAIDQLEEQGVDVELLEELWEFADKSISEANTSFMFTKDSEDPALWRIAKEDHRQAKEVVKQLLEEVREARSENTTEG